MLIKEVSRALEELAAVIATLQFVAAELRRAKQHHDRPSVLIGPKAVRSRVLKDHEIVAYLRAAKELNYPFREFLNSFY